MFLERIAIFTLELKEKLETFFKFLIRETNSQIAPLLFFGCLLVLSFTLFYVWIFPFPLWTRVLFSLTYFLCLLFAIAVLHFHLTKKRIRKKTDSFEVYRLDEVDLKSFEHLPLKAIPLSEVQVSKIFKAFSEKYWIGDLQVFLSLIQLQSVSQNKKLVWTDTGPKLTKQVNRQTLLEFLSQLFTGFENLENQQMIELVTYYFILKDSDGSEHSLSSKNISDWKKNKAAYLDHISDLIKKNL